MCVCVCALVLYPLHRSSAGTEQELVINPQRVIAFQYIYVLSWLCGSPPVKCVSAVRSVGNTLQDRSRNRSRSQRATFDSWVSRMSYSLISEMRRFSLELTPTNVSSSPTSNSGGSFWSFWRIRVFGGLGSPMYLTMCNPVAQFSSLGSVLHFAVRSVWRSLVKGSRVKFMSHHQEQM